MITLKNIPLMVIYFEGKDSTFSLLLYIPKPVVMLNKQNQFCCIDLADK